MEIKENSLYFLFRRGKEEHIKALYEKGEIYINTIDFIRVCDDNQDRSDPEDGLKERRFFGKVKIKISDVGADIEKDGTEFNGENCVLHYDNELKGNIYCLSGIYTKDITGKRDNLEFKNKSFGDSLILIHNPKKFIERIISKLEEKGYADVKYGPVKYYEDNYTGPVGFFRKNKIFSPQNEFRFFIPNKKNEVIKIKIGSLEDIAKIKNNGLLKFTFTDNKEQTILI